MHPDVVADRGAQEAIDVHQTAGHQRATVLGGDDHQVGLVLFSGLAETAADVAVPWMAFISTPKPRAR